MLPLDGRTLNNKKYTISLADARLSDLSQGSFSMTSSPDGKDNPKVEATPAGLSLPPLVKVLLGLGHLTLC